MEGRQKADSRGSGKVETEEFGKLHDRLRKCFHVGEGRRREHGTSRETLLHRGRLLEVSKPERKFLKKKEEHLKNEGQIFPKLK